MSELTIKKELSGIKLCEIGHDGEVRLITNDAKRCVGNYIDKQDAIAIIQHLQKQFNI